MYTLLRSPVFIIVVLAITRLDKEKTTADGTRVALLVGGFIIASDIKYPSSRYADSLKCISVSIFRHVILEEGLEISGSHGPPKLGY